MQKFFEHRDLLQPEDFRKVSDFLLLAFRVLLSAGLQLLVLTRQCRSQARMQKDEGNKIGAEMIGFNSQHLIFAA
jgi:hypothetical protein